MSEIWKAIVGWEGWFEVSSLGRIRRPVNSLSRYKTELIRKASPCKGNAGYLQVTLKSGGKIETVYVHHAVCTAFHGPRPAGMDCCHNSGDLTDNSANNLRWDTKEGNEADRLLHGTSNRGDNHGMAKLTESQVINIKRLLMDSVDTKTIANHFNVTEACIKDIEKERRWKHITWPSPSLPPINLWNCPR